uniref:ATP synthase F0 subunit 6 n=1 Tax=Panagrolaimus sp. ES5 TaxID=591445 RepID=A0AC34GVB4_9BILA
MPWTVVAVAFFLSFCLLRRELLTFLNTLFNCNKLHSQWLILILVIFLPIVVSSRSFKLLLDLSCAHCFVLTGKRFFNFTVMYFNFYNSFRYGGRSCFGEGRLGYASGLNFVVLIINIVLFILNLLNLAVWKLERIYSIICTILFAIATGLLLWYMIQHENFHSTLVITAILLFVQTLLFLWDVKILQGGSFSVLHVSRNLSLFFIVLMFFLFLRIFCFKQLYHNL